VNVLRKHMQGEAERLKPLLEVAYGSIVRYQQTPSAEAAATLRRRLEPAIGQLMVFRPYMPRYKQDYFDVLEDRWPELPPGDLIMLFDHCVEIMHLRLSRELSPEEAQQPWSRELRAALDQRRLAPNVAPAQGDFACAGLAAAPGVAIGPARVVGDVADLESIRAGEILVCHMTSAEWLRVFDRVRAIVADQGGLACHAAIAAREFGLPCVTGCRDATDVLATGEMVEVNGDLGIVTRRG